MESILNQIENGPVWFDLMLASTAESLLTRLERHSTIRELKLLLVNPGVADHILERAGDLLMAEAPRGYLNPGDRALSAYLYVLSHTPYHRVLELLRHIAEEAPSEFLMSRPLARYFLEHLVASLPQNLEQIRAQRSAAGTSLEELRRYGNVTDQIAESTFDRRASIAPVNAVPRIVEGPAIAA